MSPAAKGLFHRVVGMSGSPFGAMLGPVPLATAEAQGLALQKELGAASLAALRALPGDTITAATTRRDAIVQDGRIVTGTAEQVFAARTQNDVPILIGYTKDESFRPLGPVADRAALTRVVRDRFGGRADAILAAYADTDARRAAADIARDATVGFQMAEWATFQARYGRQPAYAYLFTRRQPYAPGVVFSDHDPATVGAYHSGDVPYWLRTRESLDLFRRTRMWEAGDVSLEREMAGALLAFARGGIPASPVVGRWPMFDAAAPRLVWLAPESRAMAWPHFADMALFRGDTVPPRPTPARPRD
jgi:para-nitrobenzyl esterase